ncbi:MAG: SGNH/GDSL hydrolase family protein [Clostridia bacterium]|nr:SGNH/GDSL hydrolase family protein [Clostridia bacterium]
MAENNRYAGKRFSILGDSISTLEGYNPPGYAVFYTGEVRAAAGVTAPEETWWGMAVSRLEGELLVNNSYSGSRVSRLPGGDLFPSGCSDERTGALDRGGKTPDVILVCLGMNDWGYGVKCRDDGALPEGGYDTFEGAYRTMIAKLQRNYPAAEICPCTFCTAYMPSDYAFSFPYRLAGTHIEDFNDVIREICAGSEKESVSAGESKGRAGRLHLLDLYRFYTPYAAIEGFHPTRRGMETLADLIVRALTG